MNEHRARFEHEEMDAVRNTGHLAQDAIELRGKRPTRRQRRATRPRQRASTVSQSSVAAMRRRGGRARAGRQPRPSRWFTDTVRRVATRRNANPRVMDERTDEIWRK